MIRELAPRAGLDPRAQGALIEAYRATANMPAACGAMREFVSRFPDNPRSQQYRQLLDASCGETVPGTEAAGEWLECAAQGDQRCVIRSLASRGRLNPRELSTLIEAYRATSDTPRMCSSMRDFATRFPDNSRSVQYRAVLSARCAAP